MAISDILAQESWRPGLSVPISVCASETLLLAAPRRPPLPAVAGSYTNANDTCYLLHKPKQSKRKGKKKLRRVGLEPTRISPDVCSNLIIPSRKFSKTWDIRHNHSATFPSIMKITHYLNKGFQNNRVQAFASSLPHVFHGCSETWKIGLYTLTEPFWNSPINNTVRAIPHFRC